MGLKRTLSSFIKFYFLSQKLLFIHKVGWTSVQTLALPLNLSEVQFLHPGNGNYSRAFLIGCYENWIRKHAVYNKHSAGMWVSSFCLSRFNLLYPSPAYSVLPQDCGKGLPYPLAFGWFGQWKVSTGDEEGVFKGQVFIFPAPSLWDAEGGWVSLLKATASLSLSATCSLQVPVMPRW